MFVYIIIEKNSVRQVQKQSFIPNEKTCGTKILGLNFDFDFEFGHLEKNDFDFDFRLW